MSSTKYSFPAAIDDTMRGAVIAQIEGVEHQSEEVKIYLADGGCLKLYHSQDCCETVDLYDFVGDPDGLRGAIVLSFEGATKDASDDKQVSESGTWTFYKLETSKGGLWMRWLGQSNGYYGEAVAEDFTEGDLRLRVDDKGVVSAYPGDSEYGREVEPLAQMEFTNDETLFHWATAVARLQ